MIEYRNRHSWIFKAIAIGVVCLFLMNQIAWAYPDALKPEAGLSDEGTRRELLDEMEDRYDPNRPFDGAGRMDKPPPLHSEWYNRCVQIRLPEDVLRDNHIRILETADTIVETGDGKIDKDNITNINIDDYINALIAANDVFRNESLSAAYLKRVILSFHFRITHSDTTVTKWKGRYRTKGIGKRFDRLLEKILSSESEELIRRDPVRFAAEVFVEVIKIHAFYDGNHRAADFLLNFVLVKNGLPFFMLTPENVIEYYGLLNTPDLRGDNYDIERIIQFFKREIEKNRHYITEQGTKASLTRHDQQSLSPDSPEGSPATALMIVCKEAAGEEGKTAEELTEALNEILSEQGRKTIAVSTLEDDLMTVWRGGLSEDGSERLLVRRGKGMDAKYKLAPDLPAETREAVQAYLDTVFARSNKGTVRRHRAGEGRQQVIDTIKNIISSENPTATELSIRFRPPQGQQLFMPQRVGNIIYPDFSKETAFRSHLFSYDLETDDSLCEAVVVPLYEREVEVTSLKKTTDWEALPGDIRELLENNTVLMTVHPDKARKAGLRKSQYSILMYKGKTDSQAGRVGILLLDGVPVIRKFAGKEFMLEAKGVGVAGEGFTGVHMRGIQALITGAQSRGSSMAEFIRLEEDREESLLFAEGELPRAGAEINFVYPEIGSIIRNADISVKTKGALRERYKDRTAILFRWTPSTKRAAFDLKKENIYIFGRLVARNLPNWHGSPHPQNISIWGDDDTHFCFQDRGDIAPIVRNISISNNIELYLRAGIIESEQEFLEEFKRGFQDELANRDDMPEDFLTGLNQVSTPEDFYNYIRDNYALTHLAQQPPQPPSEPRTAFDGAGRMDEPPLGRAETPSDTPTVATATATIKAPKIHYRSIDRIVTHTIDVNRKYAWLPFEMWFDVSGYGDSSSLSRLRFERLGLVSQMLSLTPGREVRIYVESSVIRDRDLLQRVADHLSYVLSNYNEDKGSEEPLPGAMEDLALKSNAFMEDLKNMGLDLRQFDPTEPIFRHAQPFWDIRREYVAQREALSTENLEILVPQELIPNEEYKNRLIAEANARAVDVTIVTLEQAVHMATTPTTEDGRNRIILLTPKQLQAHNKLSTSHCHAQKIILQNYDFLYLEGAIALARSIHSKDREAVSAFHRLLTGREPKNIDSIIERRRTVEVPLLSVDIEHKSQDYKQLQKEAFVFLKAA